MVSLYEIGRNAYVLSRCVGGAVKTLTIVEVLAGFLRVVIKLIVNLIKFLLVFFFFFFYSSLLNSLETKGTNIADLFKSVKKKCYKNKLEGQRILKTKLLVNRGLNIE